MRLFKTIVTFCLVAFSCYGVWSQNVTLENIASFENQRIVLCEKITGTFQSKKESKVTFLNFGAPYPNHSFTAVIFKKDLEHFRYDPVAFLKNKTVCVTGKVILYHDKAEIIITSPDQIVVKEN